MKSNREKIKRLMGGRYYERKVTLHSLLSTAETAKVLGITPRHVYNLSKAGILKMIRKGKGKTKKRLFFIFADVHKYLEGRR